MDAGIYRRRKMTNRIGLTLSMAAMALGLTVLLWILVVLFKNGFAAIDWAMFTQSTPAPGSEGGGLANAIVGSLLMVLVTALVSTPIGIFAGVYLAEYGDQSKTASLTRFVTDIMLSAPSIVLGLFVYAVYVAQVKHFSGWAGSMALSLIRSLTRPIQTARILTKMPSERFCIRQSMQNCFKVFFRQVIWTLRMRLWGCNWSRCDKLSPSH